MASHWEFTSRRQSIGAGLSEPYACRLMPRISPPAHKQVAGPDVQGGLSTRDIQAGLDRDNREERR